MKLILSILVSFIISTVIKISNDQTFSQAINKDNLNRVLEYFTSMAHPAGSDNDHQQALWTLDKFKSFGLETSIAEYEPLINFPLKRVLKMTSPVEFTASLQEAVVPEDERSFDQDAVPTFLGYSANGNITNAQIVYANYCDLEDFVALEKVGIKVQGHIVMCRYGGTFRGLKVRAAEVKGAIGCLIYSDPIDDGFGRGAVYPQGPYRPETSVQRGSVQYSNFYSGDPLTPFVAAKPGAPRLNISDANIPKIPALPLSYGDASVLLQALNGSGVQVSSAINKKWQGGLSFPYFSGPAAKVDFFLEQEFKIKPIWNVMAVLPGSVEPDRVVLFGNHRDAWVNGAVDPNSGTTILLETARIFGKMYKEGWRPKRTIMFASWDGEEYGLLGSTEWVEDKVASLNKTLVAYINIDQGAYGKNFRASATPSLQSLIRNVTKQVMDPSTGKPVYDSWFQRNGADIPELGFGSDYVSFIHQVGVASMDLRFEGPYGVYHSNYDSLYWMQHFGDPGFKYHAALTEVTGKILMQLADSTTLPFDFGPYLEALKQYLADVETEFKDRGVAYDLDAIRQALVIFEESMPNMSKIMSLETSSSSYKKKVRLLNEQLAFAERFFLDLKGISGRPWYRHIIYAPGEWTGYAASTFPGVYEALDRNDADVRAAIQQVADSINRVSSFWKSESEFA